MRDFGKDEEMGGRRYAVVGWREGMLGRVAGRARDVCSS